MHRRHLLHLGLAAGALPGPSLGQAVAPSVATAAAPGAAPAAPAAALLPGGPLRLLVSFPPGGPVDAAARALAEGLAGVLGQPVIVDNKAGGNGALAAVEVKRAAPDGRTLWFSSVGAVAINPTLYARLPYDMARDFLPVAQVANNVELLVVSPGFPARTLAEFLAEARRRPQPPSMASTGQGGIPHLAIEQLADATGVPLLHVPYKGAAPAFNDLMGGQVDGLFADLAGLIGPVRAGRMRAIGLAAPQRHPALPEVKTLAEQGVPGVDTNNWYALFAPAGTPPATVQALSDAVRQALVGPALHARLVASGTEPAPSSPQALAALLQRDTAKWARLIRTRKITVE